MRLVAEVGHEPGLGRRDRADDRLNLHVLQQIDSCKIAQREYWFQCNIFWAINYATCKSPDVSVFASATDDLLQFLVLVRQRLFLVRTHSNHRYSKFRVA